MNMQIASALMTMMILAPTTLWAGCEYEDRGSPHAEQPKNKKTDMMRDRLDNPWRDLFWRGKDYGLVVLCDANAGGNCTHTWTQSVSRSTTWGVGGGISAGNGGSSWFAKAAKFILPVFEATFQKETARIELWGLNTPFGPGKYAEPVMAQDRRWSSGYFRGGWVLYETGGNGTRGNFKYWCYKYDDNVAYGRWGSHAKDGEPFRTVIISSSRP